MSGISKMLKRAISMGKNPRAGKSDMAQTMKDNPGVRYTARAESKKRLGRDRTIAGDRMG